MLMLQNLKLKRENSPELNEFLRRVIEKKDIFKSIRETAELFSRDSLHKSAHHKIVLNASLPHTQKHFKREYSRPVNDVYPYADDYGKLDASTLRRRRYERLSGELNEDDYNPNEDYGSNHIRVNPRGEVGVREVPGEKYSHRFANRKHLSKRDLSKRLALGHRIVYKQPNEYVNLDSDKHFLTSSNFEKLSQLFSNRDSEQINKIIARHEQSSKKDFQNQRHLKKHFRTSSSPEVTSAGPIVNQHPNDRDQDQRITLLDVDHPTSAIEQYLLLTKPNIFVTSGEYLPTPSPDASLGAIINTESGEFSVKESKDMVHDSQFGDLLNDSRLNRNDDQAPSGPILDSQTDMRNTINNLVQALNEANRKLKNSKYLNGKRDDEEESDFQKRKLLYYDDHEYPIGRRVKRRLPKAFGHIYSDWDGNGNEMKNWEDEYGEEEDFGPSRKATYNNKKNVKNHFDNKFIEVKSSEDEFDVVEAQNTVEQASSVSMGHGSTTHSPLEMLGARKNKTMHKPKHNNGTMAPSCTKRVGRDETTTPNLGLGCECSGSCQRQECKCHNCKDTNDEKPANPFGVENEAGGFEILKPKPVIDSTKKVYLDFELATDFPLEPVSKNPKVRGSQSDEPVGGKLSDIYTKFHSKHDENEFNKNDLRNVLETSSGLDTVGDIKKADEVIQASIDESAIVSNEPGSTVNYQAVDKREIGNNEEFSVNLDKSKRDEGSLDTSSKSQQYNVDSFDDVVEDVAFHKSSDTRGRKKHWRNRLHYRPYENHARRYPYRRYEMVDYPQLEFVDDEKKRRHDKYRYPKRIRRHNRFVKNRDIETWHPHKRIARWDKPHGNRPLKEWINPKNPKMDEGNGLERQLDLNSEKQSGKSHAELNDYAQMQDTLDGHIAFSIVDKVLSELKNHKELSARFLKSLSNRQHMGKDTKALEAFLKAEAENDLKHSEQMMHNIMVTLNKMITDQVQRKICKRIAPELRTFLKRIVSGSSQKETDEEAKIVEEGIPLPVVKASKARKASDYQPENSFLFNKCSKEAEHEQIVANIQEKIEMVNSLLERYDRLNQSCKDQARDVKKYLHQHLGMLQQIRRKLEHKKHTAPRRAKDTSSMVPSGSSKKPAKNTFNVDAIFNEHLKKLKSDHENTHINTDLGTKSENEKECESKQSTVSSQCQKLADAADHLRQNRESEERIGRLFSKGENEFANNENVDVSKIKFEQLVPYNLG
ncbi:hypothetical protein PPYR_01181 [Photinus pyralis]|uniref:Uncharacterized protein n=1 Tax=Photinus pyralis TaxID=7054 RepID=A0A5N4B3L5_PHOPY|nr:hypothetical protein PPYR_01181 [Photinus pyralis]